jgi:DNA-binding winged helix-turn-helix (wHTH) protein
MTDRLARLLLRLSEAGEPAILWGRQAKPYLGRDFERLLDQGLLVEDAPATEWNVCSSCECDLDVRPIQHIDGRHVAACPLDQKSDLILEAEDLRSFRIGVPALVREIASASGFSNEPSETAAGIWNLGLTPSKRAAFLALSITAVLQSGLVGALRMIARSSPITMIAPALSLAEQLRFAEAEIHLVTVHDVIGPGDGTMPFAIDLAKLESPSAFAPRLVIVRSAKSVTLDGVSSTLSDQSFELLCLLAERASTDNPFASTRDVEARIWGDSIHRVSRAARDVVRELRNALAADVSEPDALRQLIENKRNRGWRLTLTADEIDLRA